MRANIKKVFWFYFILFLSMILYLLNFSIVESKSIIGNSYNPRINRLENTDIIRGDILDKNGEIIATTENNIRKYPYGEIFSHIVGFNSNGKSGVEVKYNFDLTKLNNEIYQRFKKEANKNSPLKANSLVLTIDKNLQQFVYEKLNKRKGAVVVMNSKTGEIVSMVSYPDFNPQTINENFEKLKSDEINTPLLNRATQGLYPPASVFKIITAIAFIEENIDWKNYTYNCTGEYTVEDKKISCFNGNKHGKVNLEKALAQSCNTFFASLSNDLKPSSVKKVAEKFLFNKDINFPLEYKNSSFTLENSANINEILQTYIGQGKTLTTPLHIALIGSAIANNGVIMKPYIIDSILNYDGKTISKNMPKQLTTAIDLNIANEVRNMLEKVVEEGTAKKAQNTSISISGKTGTAQIDGEKDHTWFLGMAPAENPSMVISIILENSGASDIVEISKDILKKALNIN